MSKLSNKILIITLVSLVALFVLSRVFRSPALESNVQKELVKLDSSKVTQVMIQPAAEEGKEIRLVRQGDKWNVVMDNRQEEAERGAVQSMLGVMLNLEAQRMVSRKKEKWNTYEVGDQGTRVSIFAGSDKQADFHIGKLNFAQSRAGGYGGGGYTYVRMTDEDEVFTVDGFIGTHFNRKFNDWRNKGVLRVKKNDIKKLSFNYPDSSFVVEKRDSVWYINSISADESKVDLYLGKVQFRNINEFAEDFVPSMPAPVSLQIDGDLGSLATVKAWPLNEEEWIVTSSLQNEVYFKARRNEFVKAILVGADNFM